MIPNHLMYHSLGKLLFSLTDGLCGVIIYYIFRNSGIKEQEALRYASFWIFNPFVIYLATRGSADSLQCLLVFLILLLLQEGKIRSSAVVYGLSVHFRIYPIIYALAFFNYCFSKSRKQAFRFIWISGFTFLLIETLFTLQYGSSFLMETLFYHAQRVDIRHNYSVFFYPFYLLTSLGKDPGLWVWLPQLLLFPVISFKLYRDLPFAVFLLSFLFVTMNKVITAQYFNWWLAPLVLILPQSTLSLYQWMGVSLLFLVPQNIWNYAAYQLEFNGVECFVEVWFSCLLFFVSNVILLIIILRYHNFVDFKCKTI